MTTRTTVQRFARFLRLRRSPALRQLTQETRLSPADFIYPLFVVHGQGARQEIASMPGQHRLSVDLLAGKAKEMAELGIPAVLLFGLPATKDDLGTGAYVPQGIVQEAIRAIKSAVPQLAVITDV
ncbi:MAG: porphobilinogen synthase, partial [Chloroflexi bacterium]|nr:porphobilinogen synthase [Chloroflexota bacterium]